MADADIGDVVVGKFIDLPYVHRDDFHSVLSKIESHEIFRSRYVANTAGAHHRVFGMKSHLVEILFGTSPTRCRYLSSVP